MIRVAFTMIGGPGWIGGYNYLCNLTKALSLHAVDQVRPVMFFGSDIEEADLAPFRALAGVEIVQHPVFDRSRAAARLRTALLTGRDRLAAEQFWSHDIQVVFEPAQFFGWRFEIPALAWIPDFQHRRLRSAFPAATFWRRELGFQAQVMSGRRVMLSSEDARADCERFYPQTRGRTDVVSFSVPPDETAGPAGDHAIADSHGLPSRFFYLPNQFWTHKNHLCVIEALRIAAGRGRDDIVVAVSGKQNDPRDPGHFDRVMERVAAYGLADRFRVLGLIPYPHVGALTRSCEALINASKFEGWSTTVEEAKASGAPMMLSSLRVHREQASDANFFDPDEPEALADLLIASPARSPADRANDAARGAEHARAKHATFALAFAAAAQRTAVCRP